jgi:hypothetical protein
MAREILVNECWECGVPRVLRRADEDVLARAWRRAWELRKGGLAWTQAWVQAQEEAKIRVVVVSRRYCGC